MFSLWAQRYKEKSRQPSFIFRKVRTVVLKERHREICGALMVMKPEM
jgi:hypothetical protein